jgi:hypothetical protein
MLAAGTGLLLLLTWQASAATPVRVMIGGLLWLVCLSASWYCLRREMVPTGLLGWDGEGWQLQQPGAQAMAVDVQVVWDLGSAMLIRVSASAADTAPWAGHRYSWLSAAQMPALWHGWRCAVHGRDIL